MKSSQGKGKYNPAASGGDTCEQMHMVLSGVKGCFV